MRRERWVVAGAEVQGEGAAGVLRGMRARAYGYGGSVVGGLGPFAAWLAEGAGLDPEAFAESEGAGFDPEGDEAIARRLLVALEREGIARPLVAEVAPFPRRPARGPA